MRPSPTPKVTKSCRLSDCYGHKDGWAGAGPVLIDPSRRFAAVNYRIAKGLFDHLVGKSEQRWGLDNCRAGPSGV
jgi:hypothetical protein